METGSLRERTRIVFILKPGGGTPKGNGDSNMRSFFGAESMLSPTGDPPKGNGDALITSRTLSLVIQ